MTDAERIATLRAALEPFAKRTDLLDNYRGRSPDHLVSLGITVCVAARAALAATAEPVKAECDVGCMSSLYDAPCDCRPSPAPRDAHHHRGVSYDPKTCPWCAPRDAERTSQYARTLWANQRLGDAFATHDSPLDAEREALLAFGEKVREACGDSFNGTDDGWDAKEAIRRTDLAALLPVRK